MESSDRNSFTALNKLWLSMCKILVNNIYFCARPVWRIFTDRTKNLQTCKIAISRIMWNIAPIHGFNETHSSTSACCRFYIYTECPRRKGQNFGRVFLMLKHTDITQNTYIQSWTVTEIMAREKCGLLAGLRTVPCQLTAYRMSVLDCHVRLQKYRWRSYVSTPLWLTMHVMYSAWNP